MDKRTSLTVAAIVAAIVVVGLTLSQTTPSTSSVPPSASQGPAAATTPPEPRAQNVFTTPSPSTLIASVDVAQPPTDNTPSSQPTPLAPSRDDAGRESATGADVSAPPPSPPSPQPSPEATVRYTNNGYEPVIITMKKGQRVIWVNESSSPMWIASAFHPTHREYPVVGGCLGSAFDACKGVEAGQSWSFVFDVVGRWNYHDHLKPSASGTVVVEE